MFLLKICQFSLIFNVFFLCVMEAQYVPDQGKYLYKKKHLKSTSKSHRSTSSEINCAPVEVNRDFSDPFVLSEVKREIVHEIWESSQIKNLTPLVIQLKEVLIQMADSNSFMLVDLAFRISTLDSAMVTRADTLYPNFCPLAATINNTVAWKETENIQFYVNAINILADLIAKSAIPLFTNAVLTELGCGNVTVPEPYFTSCWENGFVARYDELWNYFGDLLPCKLRKISSALVASTLFHERAHGSVINFALQPIHQKLFDTTDFTAILQNNIRFSTASNTSRCCCPDWANQMSDVDTKAIDILYTESKKIIDNVTNICDGNIASP